MSLCLCLCVCVCVCVCVCLCVWAWAWAWACVCVCVCVHVHVHVHVHVNVYVYVYVECVWKDGERTVSRAKSGETPVEASRDTNAQVVRYTFFHGSERHIEPSHGWFPPTFPQDNWSLSASSGKNGCDGRNREHVVLDLFSNLNMGNIQWLLSVNLWGQEITLRGQILVSRNWR